MSNKPGPWFRVQGMITLNQTADWIQNLQLQLAQAEEERDKLKAELDGALLMKSRIRDEYNELNELRHKLINDLAETQGRLSALVGGVDWAVFNLEGTLSLVTPHDNEPMAKQLYEDLRPIKASLRALTREALKGGGE